MVVTILLPDALRLAPRWLLALVEGLLLLTLIAADPVQITRRSTALRAVALALIGVLVLSAIWSTFQLIDDLIHGGAETNSAADLLQAGGSGRCTRSWSAGNGASSRLRGPVASSCSGWPPRTS
jgi:hypothetical protein